MKLSDVIDKRNRFHKGVVKVKGPNNEKMRLGIWVITGKRPGPALYVQAAQHPEYQGCGAIRDLAEEVMPEKLRGTLILVPLVNTPAARMLEKTIVWKDYRMKIRSSHRGKKRAASAYCDMYREWPGDPDGVLGQRMVHHLWEHFVSRSDAFVDIHSWSTFGVPAVTVDGKHRRSLELAKWTGYPYIGAQSPAAHGYWKGHYDPESDHMFMKVPRLGVPGFVLESTHVSGIGGWLVKENMGTVRRALVNLMKKMGMLPGRPDYSSRCVLFDINETHIKPKKRGLFIPEAPLGTIFKKGDVVGRVYDIDTFELLETLRAPRPGCFNAIWPVAVVSPKVDFAVSLKDNFKVLKLK